MKKYIPFQLMEMDKAKRPVRQCPANIPQYPALTTYYRQPVKVYLPSENNPNKILAYTVLDFYDDSESLYTEEQIEFMNMLFKTMKSGDPNKIQCVYSTLEFDTSISKLIPKLIQFITDELEKDIEQFKNPLHIKNIILMIDPILKNISVEPKRSVRSFLSILYEVNQKSVMRCAPTPLQEEVHRTAFRLFKRYYKLYGSGLAQNMEELNELTS